MGFRAVLGFVLAVIQNYSLGRAKASVLLRHVFLAIRPSWGGALLDDIGCALLDRTDG